MRYSKKKRLKVCGYDCESWKLVTLEVLVGIDG